jgi:hypothetical protein
MKKLLIVAVITASALAANVGVASAGGNRASVTHNTATYYCGCFGTFNLSGVHLTNAQFPGVDNGPSAATTTGGRDNFSGTVSQQPESSVTFTGPGGASCDIDSTWVSDYNANLSTCTWSETFNPDGTVYGWAIYPAGN